MSSDTFIEIKDYTTKIYMDSSDSQHAINHVYRVIDNAERIIKELGVQDIIDKTLLISACYLHDIEMAKRSNGKFWNLLKNHFFERKFNKRNINKLLSMFDLSREEKTLLREAVVYHSHSIPYRRLCKRKSLISRILQDADSLDYISEERLYTFCAMRSQLLSFLSIKIIKVIKKHIDWFLNFPELKGKI